MRAAEVSCQPRLHEGGSEPLADTVAILLIGGAQSHKTGWQAIVRRVNNMRNPDFVDPGHVIDTRFEEIAELASALQDRGTLYWVRLGGAQTGHAVVLHSYSPSGSAEVARLRTLLSIARPTREGDDIVIPVGTAIGSPDSGTIAIETRSVLDLMRLAAAISNCLRAPIQKPWASLHRGTGKGIRMPSVRFHGLNRRHALSKSSCPVSCRRI